MNRTNNTFFKPTEAFEITGQVGNVCFLEGMVYFKGKWLLYYGTADSKIAVAEALMYDYRGVLDHRAKARKEAANIEATLSNSEEVFHHQQQEMISRMKKKFPVGERKRVKDLGEQPHSETQVEDNLKASTPLDDVAEEL